MKRFIWNPKQEVTQNGENDDTSYITFEERCAHFAENYKLTPKESEVMMLWARGRSSSLMEEEMSISANTVATHIKHIYQKADLHSRQELIDCILR